MKALNSCTEKIITITIEATEDEWLNLLDSLQQYNGYGAVEDLERIIYAQVGEPTNGEIMVANEK